MPDSTDERLRGLRAQLAQGDLAARHEFLGRVETLSLGQASELTPVVRELLGYG